MDYPLDQLAVWFMVRVFKLTIIFGFVHPTHIVKYGTNSIAKLVDPIIHTKIGSFRVSIISRSFLMYTLRTDKLALFHQQFKQFVMLWLQKGLKPKENKERSSRDDKIITC